MNTNALKAIADRIMFLEDQRNALAEDQKEIYAQAKNEGYDVKVLRKVIKLLQMDQEKRHEEEALIELYEGVLQSD